MMTKSHRDNDFLPLLPLYIPPTICHETWLLVYQKSFKGILIEVFNHPDMQTHMHYHMTCCGVQCIGNLDLTQAKKPAIEQLQDLIETVYQDFVEEAVADVQNLKSQYREYQHGLQ